MAEVGANNSSGARRQAVYRAEDLRSIDPALLHSEPGSPPYLRGSHALMYQSKPWRIFQLSGFGNPEDEGERIEFLLEQGETGFIMEHDRNTADHLYDVDHPDVEARREDVGLTGAVILSLDDYETVLRNIDIGNVYAHPGGGVVQHAPFTLACYWSLAQRRGISFDSLNGTGQADFFLTYLGCFPKQQIPTAAGLRLNADTIEFCMDNFPHWVPVSIAGYNGADSGLSAVEELGAVMANAVEYLDAIKKRGSHALAQAAAGIGGVNFRTSMNMFEDIAKLRAARVMWSRLLKERYGVEDPRASKLRIHALTAGSMMTYQQPLNNIIRGTIMALAGVLGGTQSLGVSGYDEAISVPSEHAHQMSLRIQQVLQHEVGLTDVVDPLGGSYYVESLTSEIHDRAWEFLEDIDAEGGFLATVDSGWLLTRAAGNVTRDVQAVGSGARKVVGVNLAQGDIGEFEVLGFEGTTDAWERAIERLTALRRTRDGRRHARAMGALEHACKGEDNVLPPMMEAVQAGATLGDIGAVFRDVFGDWTVPSVDHVAVL